MFNVLLVEDNSGTQILLKNILKRKFYCNVYTAKDGIEALKLVTISKPDFILLDYMMPHMDGYEFLKELKERKIHRNIPVIVISAVNDKSSLQKILSLGVKDYILKPFNIENTMEKIAKVMNERNKDLSSSLKNLESRVTLLERQNKKIKKLNSESSLI
ncbi:MAG: response regulator, partial [Ignavibacteriae bacterium]|nr:response regulator [Ignavibacteriota bacterium]